MAGEFCSPAECLERNNGIAVNLLLSELVLAYVSVRDLFSCCQVSRIWQRVSLQLLRKKLKWVLCSSPRTEGDDSCCMRAYCSNLRRVCSIARQVRKKPSLHFLLTSSRDDDEHSVVNEFRHSLPHDCVTLLFKSKDRLLLLEGSPKGLNGVLVFHDITRDNRSPLRGSKHDAQFESSASDTGSLSRVSRFFRRWVLGDRGGSIVACFKSTSAGVLTFQSRLSVPLDEAGSITTYCTDKATGYKLQVTNTVLHPEMKRRSVESILILQHSCKNLDSIIVVVLQNDSAETLGTEYLRCFFSDVPVICMAPDPLTEPYTWNGSTTPPRAGEITIVALTLLPKRCERRPRIKSFTPV